MSLRDPLHEKDFFRISNTTDDVCLRRFFQKSKNVEETTIHSSDIIDHMTKNGLAFVVFKEILTSTGRSRNHKPFPRAIVSPGNRD